MEWDNNIDETITKLKRYSGRNLLSLGSPFTFGGFGNISATTFRSPVDDIKDMSEMMEINNIIDKLERKIELSKDEIDLINKITKE